MVAVPDQVPGCQYAAAITANVKSVKPVVLSYR